MGTGSGVLLWERYRCHLPSPPLGPFEDAGEMTERAEQREREGEQGLVSRLMADIDPELLAFLRAQVDSFAKWDLLHFFYENPNTADTASNIALYIGRNPASIEGELDELVNRGVLVVHSLGQIKVYSLSPDPTIWERVRQFIQACGDREFRIKAIYHIVRGLR